MQLDPRAIHVYTDGSCYSNPGGVSGCAALVVYPDHLSRPEEQIVDFGCSESNNSRMELLACVQALRWVRRNSPWPGVTRAQIISDSQYVTNYVGAARRWKDNGWTKRSGEPIENKDLWNQLLTAQSKAGIVVHFVWTPGKKSPILKRVDKAAKAAAQRGAPQKDRGYRPGTVSRSKVAGAATRYPARGDEVIIRPYRKNLSRAGEEKVRFDVFRQDEQRYTASFYAYATSLLAADLHRQHHYRVRFNDKPDYPRIVEILGELSVLSPTVDS